MPNTCFCAPSCACKVVVVGIKGCQLNALRRKLQEHPIKIRKVSPEKLLRLRSVHGLVVLTRFLNHKHSWHARQIALNVIRVDHGAADAVANAIIHFFDDGRLS